MAILQQEVDIVGKRGVGCKSSAEARNKQRADCRRDSICSLGHAKEHSDNKTTYNIYYKRAQREAADNQQMAQFSGQIAQAGADKATYTRQKHSLQHNQNILRRTTPQI